MIKLNNDFYMQDLTLRKIVEKHVNTVIRLEVEKFNLNDEDVFGDSRDSELFHVFPEAFIDELSTLGTDGFRYVLLKYLKLRNFLRKDTYEELDLFHYYILHKIIIASSSQEDYIPIELLGTGNMDYRKRLGWDIESELKKITTSIDIYRNIKGISHKLATDVVKSFTDLRCFIHPEYMESPIFRNYDFYLFDEFGFKGAIVSLMKDETFSHEYSYIEIDLMLTSGGLSLDILNLR